VSAFRECDIPVAQQISPGIGVAAAIALVLGGFLLYSWAERRFSKEKVETALKTSLAILLAGGALMVGVFMVYFMLRESGDRSLGEERAKAFAAHLNEYGESLRRRVSFPNRDEVREVGDDAVIVVPGKAIVVYFIDGKSTPQIEELALARLRDELRASAPEEVQTVVWLKRIDEVVGHYTNGTKAVRTDCVVTVIDTSRPSFLGEFLVRGDDPPEEINEGSGYTSYSVDRVINSLNQHLQVQ
jgi:hypothetical protein